VLRSVANLDPAESPVISVPVALADHSANRFFDVDGFWSVINWRRSRPRRERAAEQHPTDKSAHDAGGDFTILRSCGRRQ
jgi:hypothetical protein